MRCKILLIALLAILARAELYAQANCTTPHPCLPNWGMDPEILWPPVGDEIENPVKLPGFSIYIGSPIYGLGMAASRGIQMVSSSTNTGEGMFTCYDFWAGRTYYVCLMAHNTSAVSQGKLILEAYNSSTSAVQVLTNTANSSNDYYNGGDFLPVKFSFTATSDYDQLRVYTIGNAGYSVIIDDMQAVEVPTVTADDATIDGCGSTILRATSTNNLNVTWSPSNRLSATSGPVVTARPCNTFTYTAEYTSSCTGGCTNTAQVTVNVNPGTSISANPSTITGCGSTTLTASSTNPMDVVWTPSDGLNQTTGNIVEASPCKTTKYTATFHCPTGCTYTKEINVVVNNGSILNNSENIQCRGPISMEYVGDPCPGSSFEWKGPNNNIVSVLPSWSIASSTPDDQGTYTLKITTPAGCVSTYTTVVQMEGCCNVVADFDIDGENPLAFINKTKVNGVEATQGVWSWNFGDGSTSTIKNPAHTFHVMADYEVCLIALISDGLSTCCDKICKAVTIPDWATCQPQAAFDYKLMNSVTHQVQFWDRSAFASTGPWGFYGHYGYIQNWEWKVKLNGIPLSLPMPHLQNQLITFPGPGSYTVTLWIEYLDTVHGEVCEDEWSEIIIID
jgi:hypothetical protein